MRARDFFDEVRAAAIDAERARRMLDAMTAREGVRAQGYEPHSAGGIADPMRATDARIDREAGWRDRIERDYALIDEACAVIYGPGNTGGIASLLGLPTADAVWWRFCGAASWEKVSKAVGYSRRWCIGACATAFDLIDSLGIGAVKAGDGGADWAPTPSMEEAE